MRRVIGCDDIDRTVAEPFDEHDAIIFASERRIYERAYKRFVGTAESQVMRSYFAGNTETFFFPRFGYIARTVEGSFVGGVRFVGEVIRFIVRKRFFCAASKRLLLLPPPVKRMCGCFSA